VVGGGLDGSEDAEEVAAEKFLHVFGGVAAGHEGGGHFGEVGGGIDAFGGDGDSVEVGSDAYVVDTGDLDDVVEVIDEGVEGGAADAVAVIADLVPGIVTGDPMREVTARAGTLNALFAPEPLAAGLAP